MRNILVGIGLILLGLVILCSLAWGEEDKIVWKPLWGIDKYTEADLDDLSGNNVFDRVTIMWLLVEESKAIKARVIEQQNQILKLEENVKRLIEYKIKELENVLGEKP